MNIFKKKKILVLAAHPDDELLGLGGTIHQCVSENNSQVRVIILSNGIGSRNKEISKKEIEKKLVNIYKASEILGITKTKLHDLPDNRFDSIDLLDVIKIVESEIDDFDPDVIFTHHEMDLNIDHRIVFQAVITATRPIQDFKSIIIMTFETPSSTEWQVQDSHAAFHPNFYQMISKKNIAAKQRALKAYTTECRSYPHPRSTKALEIIARRWGTVIGVEFAEAFKIIRFISKYK
tara:strand:+ start:282 stop:986 length:705 start_codon:yes stop_codon:yes gene_type:complete